MQSRTPFTPKFSLPELPLRDGLVIVLAACFQAFGLYQVHSLSGVTEGGLLGLNLLLDHWFSISPALTSLVGNALCYCLGWKLLGRDFLFRSAIAAGAFSASYALFERMPHLWPGLYDAPLLSCVLGALFVGIGTGLCVRRNAAICGDDALAMSVCRATGVKIQLVYLASDLAVLLLSLSYIPLGRILYSLLTVTLSGQIIGLIAPSKETEE